MKRSAIVGWKCGDCGEFHDDESDALHCCAPGPEEAWACPDCEKAHDTERKALECCMPDNGVTCPNCLRDYSPVHINAMAIEVVGHCNTCNPLFTPEQQFTIERRAGDAGIPFDSPWR
jgi:hypothetical protein